MTNYVKFGVLLALAPLLANCMDSTAPTTEPLTPSVVQSGNPNHKSDFFSERRVHGYRFSDVQLESVPVGSTRDKVQLVLGSPSSTNITNGKETYYYISQIKEQTAFFAPKVIDQRIVAVTFNGNRVAKVANYGIQDGKLFDFVSRTTPTGGDEMTFVKQIFKNLIGSGEN